MRTNLFATNLVTIFAFLTVPFVASALMAQMPVACTMEAKMCPDGSYVGRIAPNCEFQACTSAVEPIEPNPISIPAPVLRPGMTSDAVKDIQAILKSDASIYTGPVTGYYGLLTETAIKKLQTRYGLPQTGVLDESTRAVLFPGIGKVEIVVVTPNGGEIWKAGETRTIYWKSIWSAFNISSPTNGSVNMIDGAQGAADAGAVSERAVASAPRMMERKEMIPPPTPEPVRPFFARASVELVRDADPSFTRSLGTVNLYDSAKVWKIPAGIPDAKDYRIRVSLGMNTPCLYRAEADAAQTGRALDASMPYPCPMMENSRKVTSLYYPMQYVESDTSDAPFTIVAGVSDGDIASMKRQITELEVMLSRVAQELARLKEVVNAL